MASRFSDSISLRTIPAVDVDDILDVEASECDEDDDEPLPDQFNTKGLLLWPPPALSEDPSNQANKWKKSQVQRSLAIVVCLWTCLGCHFLFTKPTAESETAGYKRWIPTILATMLTVVCSHVGHSDMLLYSSHSSHRSTYDAIFFVVCVVGPLLSMPILSSNAVPFAYRKPTSGDPFFEEHPFQFFKGVEDYHPRFQTVTGRYNIFKSSYYPVYYKSLLSWEQAADTISFWPPIPGQKNLPSSHHALNQWTIQNRGVLDSLPSASTKLNLQRNGMGPSELTWNDDPGESSAAIMPMIITTNQPLGGSIAISKAAVEGQALAIALDCEFISLQLESQVNVTGSTVEVNLVDSNGCSGVIELEKHSDTHETSNVMDILGKAQSDIIGMAKEDAALQRTLSYLDAYSQTLNLTSSLIAYRPGWILAEGSHKLCRRKILTAATTRAIMSHDSEPRSRDIQAASCTPQYYKSSKIQFSYTQYLGDTLEREPELIYHPPDVVFPDAPFGGQSKWYADHPRNGTLELFDELFFRHVLTLASQPSLCPGIAIHVQGELSDIYWDRPIPVGSLLMGSKFLRSSFVEALVSAMVLTLEETSWDSNSSQKREVSMPKVIQSHAKGHDWVVGILFLKFVQGLTIMIIFIASWTYWILLLCKSIDASWTIITEFARYADLELPLDRRPIATRAALLCDSRIRALLREMKDISALGSLASTLYFGFWAADGVHGRSGLSIECQAISHKGCEIEADASFWSRHSSSVPTPFRPKSIYRLAFLLLVYALLLLVQTSSTWQRTVVPWRKYPVIHLLLQRQHETVNPSTWQLFYFFFLPASIAFYFSFVWWRRLHVFYCDRQPWVSLKTAQPAYLGLTLSYFSPTLHLKKAIQNRHWIIVFLSLGTFVHAAVPALLANLYSPNWHSYNPGSITGERAFVWRDGVVPHSVDTGYGFHYALRDMIKGLDSWKQMPKWSTYRGAFLPVEFDKPLDDSGLWLMETSVLAGELHCDEVPVSLKATQTSSHGVPGRIESLQLLSSSSSRAHHYQLENPCRKGDSTTLGHLPWDDQLPVVNVSCGRWWIPETHGEAEGQLPTTWGIVWLSGRAQRSPEDRDMYFTTQPSALGMICKPAIKKGSGTLILSSADFTLRNANLFEYSQTHEQMLDSTVASQVSHGLMEAIAVPKSILTNGTLTNTPRFAGDLLSYAFYRYLYLRQTSPLNITDLQRGCSAVWSTYLSVLAQGTDLFKQPAPHTIQIESRRIEHRLDVNKTVAVVLLLFIILWAGTLATLGRIPKAYRLPIPPEPLLNSLFLLAQGGLVEKIEERVPQADQSSPEALLRKIDTWDEKFKIGVVEVDGCTKYTVDVEESVWDVVEEIENRYCDDDAEAAVELEVRGTGNGSPGGGVDDVAGDRERGGHLREARKSNTFDNEGSDELLLRGSSDEE